MSESAVKVDESKVKLRARNTEPFKLTLEGLYVLGNQNGYLVA